MVRQTGFDDSSSLSAINYMSPVCERNRFIIFVARWLGYVAWGMRVRFATAYQSHYHSYYYDYRSGSRIVVTALSAGVWVLPISGRCFA